ncbi:probable 4-coumarate--CoA ligase 1 [Octopus vulgaris]|uniref:Probable 4-coumarate--CoA ligase 1 n=1 Tax=Octopus vulgaris TaxID=6645 RepID=A0AA36FAP9_OCTVU|nr:probable 4-coumarate--CoA ligase 1 [Octopus vulgaris]
MFRRHFLNLYHRLSVMTSATVKSSLHNGSFSFPEDIAFPMYLLSKTSDFEHQTALINGETGQKFSYESLQKDSIKVSNSFFRLGLRKGDVVCLYGSNTPEMLHILCGVTAIGGIISPAMAQMSVGELVSQLRDSQSKFIVTTPECVIRAKEAAKRANGIQETIVLGQAEGCRPFSDLLRSASFTYPDVHINPRKDTALLPYSAGLSGKPKGVMLTHQNLISAIEALRQPDYITFEAGKDHNVMVFPLTHASGLVMGFGISLVQGATIVTLNRFEARSYLESFQKYKGTFTMATPSMISSFNSHPLVQETDLSSLKTIVSQSGYLNSNLIQQLSEKLKGVNIRQGYGLTETCGVGMATPASNIKNGSVGVPVPGMEVKLIDSKTKTDTTNERKGEICFRGPSVTSKFWKHRDNNEEMLLEDNWLRTGDVGTCDSEGHYTIVNTIKTLIKYKGCQVSPEEIEDLLLQHPAVLDVAVFGLPDKEAGEVPTALVVQQRKVDQKELQNFVQDNAASYKQLRGGIKFHTEIPRLPDGTISRQKIRDWFLEFHKRG